MIARNTYVQKNFAKTKEWTSVSLIADRLESALNSKHVQKSLAAANQPGRSSRDVQDAFLEEAHAIGFADESKGLFSSYTSALRPDYFMKVGETGIIMEVERGKTTINNMDLLDLWKCHICESANYLFLLVPNELRQNSRASPRKEFVTVSKRLGTFFEEDNYTNVRGLVIFGY